MAQKPPRAGRGRPKGAKDKVQRTVKENVLAVFEKLGGVDAMWEWASENRNDFYRLYSKLLPKQIEGEVRHEHNHLHRAASEVDGRIEGMLARRQDSNRPETLPH